MEKYFSLRPAGIILSDGWPESLLMKIPYSEL
jgi:hypothetical protein